MSPLVSTFAGAAARAYGWVKTSLGGSFWLAQISSSASLYVARNIETFGNTAAIAFEESGGLKDILFVDSDGNLVSSTQLRLTTSSATISSLKFDSVGNIILAPTASEAVVKISKTGTVAWQKSTNATYGVVSIAVAPSGNIYVATMSSTPASTTFIYKFDSSGSLTWIKTHSKGSTAGSNVTLSLAIDSSENLYILRSATNLNSLPSATFFKLDTSGTIQWSKSDYASSLSSTWYLPDTVSEGLHCVTTDLSGNVFIVLKSSTSSAIYKYDSSGTQLWNRTLNSSAIQEIAVDELGNCYVYLSGSPQTIVKYNSSGTIQWQRTITLANGYPLHIATDGQNGIYVTGFHGTSGTTYKPFFGRLPTDGSKTGTYSLGGASITIGTGTLTDAAGSYTFPVATETVSATTYTPTNTTHTFATATPTLTKTVI